MTIPIERTHSVMNTREFLQDLLNPKKTPRVPREIRERARRCLRHYPGNVALDMAAEKVPSTWGKTGEE